MPNPRPGPLAIVRDFANGVIETREAMVQALADFEDYQRGTHYGYDGYVPGTLDELVTLRLDETISEEELNIILDSIDSRTSRK